MKPTDVTLHDQLSFARRARDYWTTGQSNGQGKQPRAISMADTWTALVFSLEDYENIRTVCARQFKVLTDVVNAVKGDPPPDTLWSHHDAADLVRDLKKWAVAMEDSRNFWQGLANERAEEIARLQELK
jgi:hypothetical protein